MLGNTTGPWGKIWLGQHACRVKRLPSAPLSSITEQWHPVLGTARTCDSAVLQSSLSSSASQSFTTPASLRFPQVSSMLCFVNQSQESLLDQVLPDTPPLIVLSSLSHHLLICLLDSVARAMDKPSCWSSVDPPFLVYNKCSIKTS